MSIQAQVVNMLEDLQEEMGLTYLFVAHDLSMVRHISRRIGVMYLGHTVEISPSKELYKSPLHPYTKALLSAIPIPDPRRARDVRRIALSGDVPSPSHSPTGCPFVTRCPLRDAQMPGERAGPEGSLPGASGRVFSSIARRNRSKTLRARTARNR